MFPNLTTIDIFILCAAGSIVNSSFAECICVILFLDTYWNIFVRRFNHHSMFSWSQIWSKTSCGKEKRQYTLEQGLGLEFMAVLRSFVMKSVPKEEHTRFLTQKVEIHLLSDLFASNKQHNYIFFATAVWHNWKFFSKINCAQLCWTFSCGQNRTKFKAFLGN